MEKKTSDYVAVIYVHGMGEQRRYEEVSRLIDSLDTFLSHSKANGSLRKIRPYLQLSLNDPNRTETYIQAENIHNPEAAIATARFYEVYWAPIMAQHSSTLRVLVWLFSQIRRPLQVVQSQWRDRPRLRRAALAELYENRESWKNEFSQQDFLDLIRLYFDFERPDARKAYPKGSFKDFLKFLAKKMDQEAKRSTQEAERYQQLARRWRYQYYTGEIKNTFLLITLGLMLVLLAGISVSLILFLLQQISGWSLLRRLLDMLPVPFSYALSPTWTTAAGLAVSLGSLLGIGRFLTTYLGDVESWATYEETEARYQRRKKVIRQGLDVIFHVLKDPQCKRAVIVSHSLGTTVAYDTLLKAIQFNKAHKLDDPVDEPIPLKKITHFVTFGSPIDKIHYLFESYKSRYHRYKRVVEELRGDIGDPPFSRNGKPHIHWINYWDEGDIISGKLHSPAYREKGQNWIKNIHVSNLYFPDPAESHGAYMENRRIIADLFNIIFQFKEEKGLFYNPNISPTVDNRYPYGHPYDGIALKPEDATGKAKIFAIPAISLPWLFLLGLILRSLSLKTAVLAVWSLAAIALIFVAGGFVYGKMRGHRTPLSSRLR